MSPIQSSSVGLGFRLSARLGIASARIVLSTETNNTARLRAASAHQRRGSFTASALPTGADLDTETSSRFCYWFATQRSAEPRVLEIPAQPTSCIHRTAAPSPA